MHLLRCMRMVVKLFHDPYNTVNVYYILCQYKRYYICKRSIVRNMQILGTSMHNTMVDENLEETTFTTANRKPLQ
jgi:hypothetical protein